MAYDDLCWCMMLDELCMSITMVLMIRICYDGDDDDGVDDDADDDVVVAVDVGDVVDVDDNVAVDEDEDDGDLCMKYDG